jgi:hypothetical protein
MKPNQVSRILKAGGLRPIGRDCNREGIVCTGNFIRISVDNDRLADALAQDVGEVLVAAGLSFYFVSERIIRVCS